MTAWNTLLKIRESVDKMNSADNSVVIQNLNNEMQTRNNSGSGKFSISIDFSKIPVKRSVSADIHIFSEKPFDCKIFYKKPFKQSFSNIFELYLPYALLNRYSRLNNKTYVVSHFAQSLDGRIASVNGNSKWIGNRQNLIHAHRMRALMDGILIGSGTIRKDNPQLTVRHVKGLNPCKIILGSSNFHTGKVKALSGQLLQFSRSKNGFKKHIPNSGLLDPDKILKKLFDQQIKTLYLEGGSITTSCFLQAGVVDQVQVHFAPLIIGSGITGFNFTGIEDIDRAIKFKSYRFLPVGDQIMFTGEI